MSEALIIRDDTKLTVTWTGAALEMKESALATAGLVGRVSTPEENASAVAAAIEVAYMLKQCESTRKACKEPVLEFGRRIDDAAKAFAMELLNEKHRLDGLLGDYMQLEEAKRKAAEAARIEDLNKIERERQEALSKATTHEELEAIQERTNQAAAVLTPVPEAVRATGQSVSEEWVITGIREFELMRARPDLVRKVEFDLTQIKAELKSGRSLAGVTAHKETKSKVRAGCRPLTLTANE